MTSLAGPCDLAISSRMTSNISLNGDSSFLQLFSYCIFTNIFDHAKNYDIDVEVATSHDRLVTAILA
jgi:hypothetical protein